MTTNLLIFFAIPLAVIIFSIALQKILKNPFLVAAIIFSVLLIIVIAFFDTIFLIAVVVYTIISFITALLTCMFCRVLSNQICNCMNNNTESEENYTFSNADIKRKEDIYTICDKQSGTNFSGVTGNYVQNYNRRR